MEYSSVQKAIQILLAFMPENHEMGTLELSRVLGINKSTVSRLMQVLIYYDLIQQNEKTKKFSLGRTSAALGMAIEMSQSDKLADVAQPYLDDLRDTVNESVCLEVLFSGRVKIIAEAIGPPPLSVSFRDQLPFHMASGGKAILAFSDAEVVESFSDIIMRKNTQNTITNFNKLKKHFEEIRKEGVAYDLGEANLNVSAVAAPVFNHRKKPVGAVCICIPSSRADSVMRPGVIKELRKTANMISKRLFY